MLQEPNDQLDRAVTAYRSMPLNGGTLDAAEVAILSRFGNRLRFRYWAILWAGGTAAGLGLATMLWPARSAASALLTIGKNGDAGMRHVVEDQTWIDGSVKKLEFFACGDRARFVQPDGSQEIWGKGRPVTYYPNGSAFIWPGSRALDPNRFYDWSGFTIRQVALRSPQRVTVAHGVVLNGQSVDRYEVGPYPGATNMHTTFFVDPVSERPLREELDLPGHPRVVTTWDYPAYDERLLEGPRIDPKRFYDGDAEQASMLAALQNGGPVKVVSGKRIQLVQLWADEEGNLAAITYAGYSYPGNYSLRINGKKVALLSESPADTSYYHVEYPFTYKGRKMQIFNAFCGTGEPKPKIPDVVTLSIPVVEGKKRVGYAEFKNVPVHRTWDIHEVLSPTRVPFFADSMRNVPRPSAPGTVARSVKS